MNVAHRKPPPPERLLGGVPWTTAWPGIEVHLRRVLRSRVPPGLDVSDLIQETAVRLLRRANPLSSPDDAARMATRIAINLAIDQGRRSRRISWCALTRDIADGRDLEDQVLSRIDNTEMRDHAARADIDLEVFESSGSTGRADSPAVRSRRYRARKKLRLWREGLGGAFGLRPLRWLVAAAAATAAAPSVLYVPPEQAPLREQNHTQVEAFPGSAGPRLLPLGGGTGWQEPSRRPPPAVDSRQSELRGPVYRRQLKVAGPAGTGVEKGTREYPPEEPPPHLVCVRNITPAPDLCVPKAPDP